MVQQCQNTTIDNLTMIDRHRPWLR
jgi:hypothetical protein